MKTKLIGGLLLGIGGLLLLYNSKLIVWSSLLRWSFILTILGIIMIFIGFYHKNPTIVLSFGLFTAITFFTWGHKYVGQWDWSVLLSFISIAFILLYLVNKQPLTGLSGFVMLIGSLFANPAITEVEFLSPVSAVMHRYWPALFVFLGIVFLFRK